MLTQLFAVEHLQKMRGGAQSHLIRCSDNLNYIVKFRDNPQGARILANELLGTLLAEELGLSVPKIALVELWSDFIRDSEGLTIQLNHSSVKPRPGICFGSRHLSADTPTRRRYLTATFDTLPVHCLGKIDNLSEFAGMLVFDKWTCNTDGRQVVFTYVPHLSAHRVTMIDNGFCFGAKEWIFPDAPLQGVFRDRGVYKNIVGLRDFEPWISRLEEGISLSRLSSLAEQIPPDWYDRDFNALGRLIELLDRRRLIVRRLLASVWETSPGAFPMWQKPVSTTV